jgi:hypothetical protein
MADTKGTGPSQDEGGPIYTIRDFGGMQPNRDPHDVSAGKSVHQVNCGVGPAGELRVRLGAAVVRFGQN